MTLILYIFLRYQKSTPKYQILIEEGQFNGNNISLLKSINEYESIFLKKNYFKKYIVSLSKKDYLREYYVDSFIVNVDNSDYIIIISSWNDGSDLQAYNIYVFDGEKEINSEQNIIWFGKWFNGNPSLSQLIYSNLSKKEIISELKKVLSNKL
jgi:hypothetical protein